MIDKTEILLDGRAGNVARGGPNHISGETHRARRYGPTPNGSAQGGAHKQAVTGRWVVDQPTVAAHDNILAMAAQTAPNEHQFSGKNPKKMPAPGPS